MPEQNDRDDDIDTQHPWIVIPYFAGDEGRAFQRPLSKVTPAVIGWLCPSIKVQGVNYTAAPGSYLPDEPLSITVDVDNRGVPNARVTVEVRWADPATGFATSGFVASATKSVAGRSVAGPTRFANMVWTPERAKIPPHFCLLVHARCTPPEPFPGPVTPDPLNDRHWAQYNLQTAVITTAKSHTSLFWAGNPLTEAAAYTVTARALSEDSLQAMARIVKAEPVPLRGRQVSLRHAADAIDGGNATGGGNAANAANATFSRHERDASVVLELAAGERQPLVVTAHDLELGAHQFAALEMVQTRVGGERQHGASTGSLGIVLFARTQEVCHRRVR